MYSESIYHYFILLWKIYQVFSPLRAYLKGVLRIIRILVQSFEYSI